jgi:C_GCAxxG_C_C family probable redox protein
MDADDKQESSHSGGGRRKFSDLPPRNESEASFMEPGTFYSCSQVILKTFYERYGSEIEQMMMVAGPLGAGVAQTRDGPCGALLGACMIMGLEHGVRKMDNLEDKYGLYEAIQNTLLKKFRDQFGSTACRDLISSRCTNEELDQKLHHERICRHSVRFVHDWLVTEMGIKPSGDIDARKI